MEPLIVERQRLARSARYDGLRPLTRAEHPVLADHLAPAELRDDPSIGQAHVHFSFDDREDLRRVVALAKYDFAIGELARGEHRRENPQLEFADGEVEFRE